MTIACLCLEAFHFGATGQQLHLTSVTHAPHTAPDVLLTLTPGGGETAAALLEEVLSSGERLDRILANNAKLQTLDALQVRCAPPVCVGGGRGETRGDGIYWTPGIDGFLGSG